MRLVTWRNDNKCSLLGAFLRMGVGGAVTDNVSGSGIAVGIDIKTGRLRPPGHYRTVNRMRPWRHPDTGVEFETFTIPQLENCVRLVEHVHDRLGSLVTVGWDVAVCVEGPVTVEGNAFWQPRFSMLSDPEFLARYARAVEPWLEESDMRWARPVLSTTQ